MPIETGFPASFNDGPLPMSIRRCFVQRNTMHTEKSRNEPPACRDPATIAFRRCKTSRA